MEIDHFVFTNRNVKIIFILITYIPVPKLLCIRELLNLDVQIIKFQINALNYPTYLYGISKLSNNATCERNE